MHVNAVYTRVLCKRRLLNGCSATHPCARRVVSGKHSVDALRVHDDAYAPGARQVRLNVSVTVRIKRSGLLFRSRGAYFH